MQGVTEGFTSSSKKKVARVAAFVLLFFFKALPHWVFWDFTCTLGCSLPFYFTCTFLLAPHLQRVQPYSRWVEKVQQFLGRGRCHVVSKTRMQNKCKRLLISKQRNYSFTKKGSWETLLQSGPKNVLQRSLRQCLIRHTPTRNNLLHEKFYNTSMGKSLKYCHDIERRNPRNSAPCKHPHFPRLSLQTRQE